MTTGTLQTINGHKGRTAPIAPATAADTYGLILRTAALIDTAIASRHDRSASGFAAALQGLAELHRVQLAKECVNCRGGGLVDGHPCPNVVAHPGA
ncbi:hypothetical protein OG612_45465 (plasmid) [Streptomyces sp. NBC_01527]|uniref:hypothetical protein n=1 Tax=Streptomyces sp. NBC_01527 TaxID=2903894 RepID=UPI002F90CB21